MKPTVGDRTTRWEITAAAIPGALAIAVLFHLWPTGRFLQRTWLGMPVHELGHAVTSWWCGYGAIPTLWKTLVPEERGVVWVLVAALEGGLFWIGWQRTWMALAAAALGLALLQLTGTQADPTTAQAWITFGGDAGAMVLGTLLMASFFIPKLAEGGLRWGLLAIGAAAFVDAFATWWAARTDPDVIPFGEIEGVGLSDPTKLVEDHGWTIAQLVGRHVTVGVACLVLLGALAAWQTWRARRDR